MGGLSGAILIAVLAVMPFLAMSYMQLSPTGVAVPVCIFASPVRQGRRRGEGSMTRNGGPRETQRGKARKSLPMSSVGNGAELRKIIVNRDETAN